MCVARLQHQEELTWIRVYPRLSAVVFPLDIALGRRTENEPRINADTDTNLSMILEKETEAILSCAMEVSNILGHGLLEKPYENALAVEMRLRGIHVVQQARFDVVYKDVKVGEYVPNLIAFEKVIIDTKTIERIMDHELGQMLNYLRITGLSVGLIINFKHAKITWKRVANTKNN